MARVGGGGREQRAESREQRAESREQELHTNQPSPRESGLIVIPAQAGIHVWLSNMGPRFRGDDLLGVQHLNPEPCLLNPRRSRPAS